MIQEFVERFQANPISWDTPPANYAEIVRRVIDVITTEEEYDSPDPDRIHEIDDGDYQGTLVFVIGARGYQPSKYWFVKVSYGSCSGCDTLQAISDNYDTPPTPRERDEYNLLALHIVQNLRLMGEEEN